LGVARGYNYDEPSGAAGAAHDSLLGIIQSFIRIECVDFIFFFFFELGVCESWETGIAAHVCHKRKLLV
jgi:hypothetical protein